MFQIWDGAYRLEIVTDVSYNVYGMMEGNRLRRLKGKNLNLWRLIYQELDTKDRNLFLIKVKSHIHWTQLYHNQSTSWQIGLNELVDAATDCFSDHRAERATAIQNAMAHEALLGQVCRRIAVIQPSLREFSTDPAGSPRHHQRMRTRRANAEGSNSLPKFPLKFTGKTPCSATTEVTMPKLGSGSVPNP